MPRERYISDNPFRILGAESGLPLAELRRRADRASRGAAVGLAPDIPFGDEFGGVSFEDLPSTVRSLARDPERRTLYRILWPLTNASIALLVGRQDTLFLSTAEEEVAQFQFLRDWYGFLEQNTAIEAKKALQPWRNLCACDRMWHRLAALLIQEDDISGEAASQVVVDARRKTTEYLLERVCNSAVESWKSGPMAEAIELTKVVLASDIRDEILGPAIEPLNAFGHNLNQVVRGLTNAMPDYHYGAPAGALPEVIQLGCLANLLEPLNPSVEDWVETMFRWRTDFGWRMRQECLRLNAMGRDQQALEVVRKAIHLAIDSEQISRLKQDEQTLIRNISNQSRGKAPTSDSARPHTGGMSLFSLVIVIAVLVGTVIAGFAGTKYSNDAVASSHWSTAAPPSYEASHPQQEKAVASAPPESVAQTAPRSVQKRRQRRKNPPPEPASYVAPVPTTDTSFPSSSVDEQREKQQRRDSLESKLTDLRGQIDRLVADITAEDSSLANERSSLEELKSRIDSTIPNTYSQSEVDDYNSLVRDYEARRAVYNTSVESHNLKVEEQKRLVGEYNDIVHQINSSL